MPWQRPSSGGGVLGMASPSRRSLPRTEGRSLMYRVGKRFSFDAAHHLVSPYKGKCNRLHGHTWQVEIVLRSDSLNTCGMIVDFCVIKRRVEALLKSHLDHTTLNLKIKQPTAENIAKHIFDWLCKKMPVESVKVWESETSWAEYR